MHALQTAYEARSQKVNKIEEIKYLKAPLEVYEKIAQLAQGTIEALAQEDTAFYFKCFGLFLKEDGLFMIRVRVPAGQLSVNAAKTLGFIAARYGRDYIDITTRQQIELRYIALSDIPAVLDALESVGLSTFQTGIDNFRNIVTSAFDGLGKKSLIPCKPLVDAMQALFLKNEAYIGVLPRKFNTGILGTTVNDCNIYGQDCAFIVASKNGTLGFNLYLGGKVGIQAQDTGLFVAYEEVVPTYQAVIDLFKTYGFRDNRNKNRLHFLLEAVGMEAFVDAIKQTSGLSYTPSGIIEAKEACELDAGGVFALDDATAAYHFSIPSGILKGTDLIDIASLAAQVEGSVRLSVEQSLYIIAQKKSAPMIQNDTIYTKYDAYHTIYFNHQIACAGTATCSFGVIPNKPDAIEMAHFLSREVPIKEGKVRMYWSGCVKGCGIHGIADIGFEGCKTKDASGQTCHGVHIFMGGYATKKAQEARAVFKSVPLVEAKYLVKKIMLLYKNERHEHESFEAFYERTLAALETAQLQIKITQIAS